MIVVGEADGVRAFLIDFGFATEGSKKRYGFVGSQYTHGDIFEKYPNEEWYPKKEYDLCSLGFSMAVLVNRGEVEWDMGRFPRYPMKNYWNEKIDQRRQAAIRIIGGFDNQETDWLSWVKLDKKTNTMKRKHAETD